MPESCSNKGPPGYVYDPVYLEHDTGVHPENARRLLAVIDGLDLKFIRQQLKVIPARAATREELATVHDAEYISRV